MGNANSGSERPYYNFVSSALKHMECMQSTTTLDFKDQSKSPCTETLPSIMEAVKYTECKDSKIDEVSQCIAGLPQKVKDDALNECEDALSDYLKTSALKSFNPGDGYVPIQDFCPYLIQNIQR